MQRKSKNVSLPYFCSLSGVIIFVKMCSKLTFSVLIFIHKYSCNLLVLPLIFLCAFLLSPFALRNICTLLFDEKTSNTYAIKFVNANQ